MELQKINTPPRDHFILIVLTINEPYIEGKDN